MGRESKSRRQHLQASPPPDPPSPPAAPTPAQLLAKYDARPLSGLPDPVEKFHLKVVTDLLADHAAAPAPTGPLRATRTWHRHHDAFAASRPDVLNFGGDVKHLACARGCNHCCRSPVGVAGIEAVLVADAIDRTFTPEARQSLRRRMDARKAAQQPNHLCPLNVDGRCQVYDSRPFNCRVFHSFDVDACKKLFEDGEMGRGLPVDPIRRRYDKLIAASANVALTALDLDMRMLEFMAALELALDAGESRDERLTTRDDLFASLPTITPPWAATPE